MKTHPAQSGNTLPAATSNTAAPVRNDGKTRLPHERDEAPDPQPRQPQQHSQPPQDPPPRSVMRQAASDLEQGLVDTDCHATPGVEQVHPRPGTPGQARPQAGSKRD